ncbi:MAG: undecaprenyldiphospho-muramoylpentapeptide beta-N-acetylglucosaminyltransferase [Deltaproteobacteria bacterium]|nr:undecaprenyldiphospho-muramoylpentapeptide beta-N-acetylglucosaminyltransferase [Deltaproteobacteria bacterium]
MAKRILIAAGLTGGHIMPGVALAEGLSRILPDTSFLFVGAGRPAEGKILDPLGYQRATIQASGIKGRGPFGKLGAAIGAFRGFFKALGILRSFKPDLVFATGGYVSGPVGLAAFVKGIPLVIHEQNRRPGLTNRLLSKIAREVFLGDAKGGRYFPKGKATFTGNPVRESILALGDREGHQRREAEGITLLVLGGSQGARGVNRALLGIIPSMAKAGTKIRVIHQAGAEGEKELLGPYESSGLDFELKDFFQDMPRVLGEADLAISRAGALTLAELRAAGLPAVLVPLPTAADDHQTENAMSFVEAGCGILAPEADIAADKAEGKASVGSGLWGILEPLISEPSKLSAMREAYRKLPAASSGLGMAERIKERLLSARKGAKKEEAGEPENPKEKAGGEPDASEPGTKDPAA